MANLQVASEANVEIATGVSSIVVPARPGRRCAMFQVQAKGFGWYKLTGEASPNDGILFEGGEILRVIEGPPAAGDADVYTGEVHVMWEGFRSGRASERTITNVRVIEFTEDR